MSIFDHFHHPHPFRGRRVVLGQGQERAGDQGPLPLALPPTASAAPRPPRPQRTYLLIPGSWHDGSAWSAVADVLRAQGHQVLSPDLVGQNTAEVAQQLAAFVREHDLRQLCVVGHSYGGIVAQVLFQQIPDRIALVIFFDAFILPDRDLSIGPASASLLDELGAVAPEMVGAFQQLVDPATNTFMLPHGVFASLFIPDAPECAAEVYAQLHPEPWGRATETSDTRVFWAAIPRDVQLDDGTTMTAYEAYALASGLYLRTAYIVGAQDMALGPNFWPMQAARLGPMCKRVLLMSGAHEALFTQPEALASAILEASGDQVVPQDAPVPALPAAHLTSAAPTSGLRSTPSPTSIHAGQVQGTSQATNATPESEALQTLCQVAPPASALAPTGRLAFAGDREGLSRDLPPGSSVCSHP